MNKQGALNPSALTALISGGTALAGIIFKSNLLLIIAGIIFAIPVLTLISLPTEVYIVGILLAIIVIAFKK